MGKKSKPKSPEKIAAEAAERRANEQAREQANLAKPDTWGTNLNALRAQDDVDVVMSRARHGTVQSAARHDVFHRLHARGGLSEIALNAARRLEADMTERRGEGERAQSPKVDGAGSREIVTQRMLDAGTRVDRVLALVGIRDKALLTELLEPRRVITNSATERWRVVVVLITGERRPEVQAGAIRAACENLAAAFSDVDHRPRNAA